ncbi:MAG: hypothetical protein BWY90_00383 [Deltaproteobacteria bacterium ADurb.BinA014]|nr:MAG: hypothetical protein BWY90_00383 [Deltaproteobacteria bacterium ADurb.BinA014]
MFPRCRSLHLTGIDYMPALHIRENNVQLYAGGVNIGGKSPTADNFHFVNAAADKNFCSFFRYVPFLQIPLQSFIRHLIGGFFQIIPDAVRYGFSGKNQPGENQNIHAVFFHYATDYFLIVYFTPVVEFRHGHNSFEGFSFRFYVRRGRKERGVVFHVDAVKSERGTAGDN